MGEDHSAVFWIHSVAFLPPIHMTLPGYQAVEPIDLLQLPLQCVSINWGPWQLYRTQPEPAPRRRR